MDPNCRSHAIFHLVNVGRRVLIDGMCEESYRLRRRDHSRLWAGVSGRTPNARVGAKRRIVGIERWRMKWKAGTRQKDDTDSGNGLDDTTKAQESCQTSKSMRKDRKGFQEVDTVHAYKSKPKVQRGSEVVEHMLSRTKRSTKREGSKWKGKFWHSLESLHCK